VTNKKIQNYGVKKIEMWKEV